MSSLSARVSLVFSCIGHAYIHLFTAFYFVIVLGLEKAWALPYDELIGLWTVGAMLVGLAALPAGWLGDRWSASGMMVTFFVGMGVASIGCGLAGGPVGLTIGLAGIGLFASIYHPVGIAWLVRNSDANRGKVLGVNGIFGSIGIAGAGAVAGTLTDFAGWRAAFIVPGAVSIATGLALWFCLARGIVRESAPAAQRVETAPSRGDMMRVFLVLMVTMFLGAIIYQSVQTALPKLFESRLAGEGNGALRAGLYVAAVYTVAGMMQVLGGHLADKYPLKPVYVLGFLIQIPLLYLVANLSGVPLLAASMVMVMAGIGVLPAENMLLARYAPQKHHGLAFGAKFVLAFGAAPLGIFLVSEIYRVTGGFYWLFALLAGAAAVCFLATVLLPRDSVRPVVAPSASA
jgi:FSR family fosmidomycin resistance protein-like MFS transporter